jgi:hypothetical protein
MNLETNTPPSEALGNISQSSGGVGRLPRALTTVRAAILLWPELLAELLSVRVIVPEKHVLYSIAPDKAVDP